MFTPYIYDLLCIMYGLLPSQIAHWTSQPLPEPILSVICQHFMFMDRIVLLSTCAFAVKLESVLIQHFI